MKVIEVFRMEYSGYGLSEDQLNYEIQKMGLDANKEVEDIEKFVSTQSFEINKAKWIINNIITKQPSSWSQGDMSESLDFGALTTYVNGIYRKWGLSSPLVEANQVPQIRRL
ncbi:DUF6706 family protein [Dysgonomonas massiliensis]|uniref:DUF6706 family protein n=1 Tax=Dysgonomonas massiliensis TaxID=2040292 RepID=UPI0011AF9AAC|nr:DUF6706 family protein [Dysgonomonas massiliensis]